MAPIFLPTKADYAQMLQGNALYEVVDKANSPFCLLPEKELTAQGLTGRSVAALLRIGKAWLCASTEKADFGFSCHARLPALFAGEEFALELVEKTWAIKVGRIRKICLFTPCAENWHTFATVYEIIPIAGFRLEPCHQAKLVTLADLRFALDRGASIDPLFRIFIGKDL